MSFLLPYHDRCLEVNVDNDQQLVVAWLEEQVFDIAEQDVCSMMFQSLRPSHHFIWNLTDFLRAHWGLVTQTVLVDLDLTRQPLAVQRRSHEYLGKLRRSTAFDLHKGILFDDVSHLLLLLLTLVDLLLQIRDLLGELVEAVTIDRPIRDGADERGIGILERLQGVSGTNHTRDRRRTVSSFLPASWPGV